MNGIKSYKRLAGALLVLALCLSLAAPALAQPVMPLLFSGDVTIGGANAPTGTAITAEIESTQVASATTTIVGKYVISIDYDSGYIDKAVVLKVDGAVGGSGTYVDPMTTPAVNLNLEGGAAADESTVDESTVDETTVDESTVDEPTVDEPTVDETATNEPAAQEPAPSPATSPTAGLPWPLIGGVCVVGLVLIIAIVALLRRRAY